MTTLEQYKKAYATLVGRVDTVIAGLERIDNNFIVEGAAIAFTTKALTNALLEAEEIFLSEDSEGLDEGE